MSLIIAFVVTSIVFLVADAIMLRSVLQPLFASHLGDALYPGGFRLVAAGLFYLVYMFGVMWFVSAPALRENAPSQALINGAVLGLVAYGTYELTSWAVMRDWSPSMVAIDMAWGTAVTAISAWSGVMAARSFA
jgi:uncharacterized membrane protein